MGVIQRKILEAVTAKGPISAESLGKIVGLSPFKLVNRAGTMVRECLIALDQNNKYILGQSKSRIPTFPCPECELSFITESGLRGHIIWKHQGQRPKRGRVKKMIATNAVFTITYADLSSLDTGEYDLFWKLLGKIVLSRVKEKNLSHEELGGATNDSEE